MSSSHPGTPKWPKMCPSATRIGCKMKGRPQVTGMTGGCAGEWLNMLFRCPHRTSARRGSSPTGQRAASRHDTDQAQSVRRRRRWRLIMSHPSSPITRHIRNTLAASPTRRITPTVIVVDQLRNDRWTPQAQPEGIKATTSRFAGAMHLPSAVRGRLAIVLRPCGGHVPRMDMVCGS